MVLWQNLLLLEIIFWYFNRECNSIFYWRWRWFSTCEGVAFFASNLETIFPYGDKVFIGSNDQVYFLGFDGDNKLDLLSSYRHITACDPVVAANGIAFSTLRNTGCRFNSDEVLDVIDISNIENPQLIKSYQTGSTLRTDSKWAKSFCLRKGWGGYAWHQRSSKHID